MSKLDGCPIPWLTRQAADGDRLSNSALQPHDRIPEWQQWGVYQVALTTTEIIGVSFGLPVELPE